MTSKCVICTNTPQPSTGTLDEHQILVFFIKKFLKYPLLHDDDEDLKCFTESPVTSLKQENPINGIWFCSQCFDYVQQAQKLHTLLVDLENQLNSLRVKVEEKVQETFEQKEEGTSETIDGKNIFKRFRNTIYCRGSILPDINVKVECPVDDFEWPNTPIGADFGETTAKVEDLVIYPSIHHLKVDDEDLGERLIDDSVTENCTTANIRKKQRRTISSSVKVLKTPGRTKSQAELRTCPICKKVFDRPSFMTKHLYSKHERDPAAKCDDCGKQFTRKDTLDLHQSLYCRAKITEDAESRSEIGTTADELIEEPETVLKSLKKSRKAGRRKSSIKSRTCQVCHRIFDRPSQMIRHVHTLHRKKGPFSCTICKMKFTRKDYFYTHKKLHSTGMSKERQSNKKKDPESETIEDHVKKGHRLRRRVNYKEIEGGSDDEILIKSEEFSFSDGWDRSSSSDNDYDSDDNYSDQEKRPKKTKAKAKNKNKTVKASKRKYTRRVPKSDRGGRPKSSIEDRTCPVCKLVFPKPSSMAVHLNVKHERKPLYNCEVCQKGFAMKAYLDSHMWVHMSEDERLKRCTSIRQKRVQNQKPAKSPLEDRTCPVCNLILATPSKMAMHLNVKHERKILFTCEICQRGFYRKDTFQGHLRTHLTPEERLTLLTTGTLPSRQIDSVNSGDAGNMTAITSESLAQGDTTNTITLTPTIKLKETRMSDVEERTCPVCQKIFDKPSRMQRHLNSVHTKAETYICEVCGKKFTWKDTLKKHMKYHDDESFISGAKDYLCSLCGISFRHKWSYERHNLCKHEQGGSNSKCFMCDMCGKTFKIRSLLVQHMKSKSHGGAGIKPSLASKNNTDSPNPNPTSGSGGGILARKRSRNKNPEPPPNRSLALELQNNPVDDTHLSGVSSVAGCNSIGHVDADLSQNSHSNQDFNSIPNTSQASQQLQLGALGGTIAGPSHHHPHQYQQPNVHPYHQLLAHQHLQGYSNAFNFVQSTLQMDHNNSHGHQQNQ